MSDMLVFRRRIPRLRMRPAVFGVVIFSWDHSFFFGLLEVFGQCFFSGGNGSLALPPASIECSQPDDVLPVFFGWVFWWIVGFHGVTEEPEQDIACDPLGVAI